MSRIQELHPQFNVLKLPKRYGISKAMSPMIFRSTKMTSSASLITVHMLTGGKVNSRVRLDGFLVSIARQLLVTARILHLLNLEFLLEKMVSLVPSLTIKRTMSGSHLQTPLLIQALLKWARKIRYHRLFPTIWLREHRLWWPNLKWVYLMSKQCGRTDPMTLEISYLLKGIL
jgi:hypothetical protein